MAVARRSVPSVSDATCSSAVAADASTRPVASDARFEVARIVFQRRQARMAA